MKRTNKLMAVFSLLISAALVLSACGPAATQAPAGPVEFKIAFFGPLTGGAASIGQEQLAFARIAVADFNKANEGKFKATLLEEDTDITPDKATPVCQKNADDATVLGVVGPAGSGQVEACAKIFEDGKLVHVSSSATRPSLGTAGFKTFFRVVPNDDAQGPTIGNFIADKVGSKTVFVMDDQSSYGATLADIVQQTLEGKGVKTNRASVTQQDNDFSALVTTIKGDGAELVFFGGQLGSQGSLLAKQLKEQGADIPVFGGDGFFSTKDYITDAGGATEGSYASIFAPDIHGIAAAAEVVKAADAAAPGWGSFGPPTYVATMVVLEAAMRASQAGTLTRDAMMTETSKTNMASTILGIPIKFDAKGEVQGASFFISQVTNGAFKQVYP